MLPRAQPAGLTTRTPCCLSSLSTSPVPRAEPGKSESGSLVLQLVYINCLPDICRTIPTLIWLPQASIPGLLSLTDPILYSDIHPIALQAPSCSTMSQAAASGPTHECEPMLSTLASEACIHPLPPSHSSTAWQTSAALCQHIIISCCAVAIRLIQ